MIKGVTLTVLPSRMVLQLNRFERTTDGSVRNDVPVTFPLNGLIVPLASETAIFDCVTISNHTGS